MGGNEYGRAVAEYAKVWETGCHLKHPLSSEELGFISIGVVTGNTFCKGFQLLRQSKKIFPNPSHIWLRVSTEAWKREGTRLLHRRPDWQMRHITETLPYF